MKVALVYDRVNKWGGAERVLLALHGMFPDAPLYTSVYHPPTAGWAKEFTVKTSFLQHIPLAKNHHELFALIMPLAFRSFSFDEYDLVISVTSEAGKGIVTRGRTKHICYLLTPTRYLWSGYNEYFKGFLLRFISFPLVWLLRIWDRKVAENPDVIISISEEVRNRARKYYNRDSVVVYPPVSLAFGSLALSGQLENKKLNAHKLNAKRSPYFLVVSRLVGYKRIDIAIEACNMLKIPLKIVGSGAVEQELKKIAGPTIEFLGNLTDSELVGYYKNCEALLFPGVEDFGLTMVEAMGLGKPVIVYRKGGALEIVKEGETGEFFYPQTTKSLIAVLRKFDSKKYASSECIVQAKKFDISLFKKSFEKIVKSVLV